MAFNEEGLSDLSSHFSKDDAYIFVQVPDLQGGYTQGTDTLNAVTMTEDLIGNLLSDKTQYPKPSQPEDIKLKDGETLVYVSVDFAGFRMKYSRTIRKNVTIPEYLNVMAKERKVNVSQVLTEALKAKLEA
ncbi:type II toxin-antitoxin system HicB family antitoxin [Levilactobacillus fuyuanensis]|uniref:Antitoxin HicB n=1 Tax=Levilactobacillus fuyuanensis TaxID=2486022 RepID=A0ABW4H6Y8_9LACO|nr:antitoxin HicB [Levilactobacillus fuyuanensis]